MNILVTAGNTRTPIDRVRCVTNTFTGKTGAGIARTAWVRGHTVTLLTSAPEHLSDVDQPAGERRLTVVQYATFDDLTALLTQHVRSGVYDVVVHSAAVSDFLVAGTYGPQPGTVFHTRTGEWEGVAGPPTLDERRAGKIASTEPELWVRLVRAPKLVDKIRPQWGFRGLLVKFKLEVGATDAELLDVAERSRQQSAADLMVANTLESARHWAFLGPLDGRYERVARRELAERLLLTLEHLRRTG
jgi:phosphopantothenoylcysteine synthetase/decarboxylase